MGKGKGAVDHWVAVIRPGPHPVRSGRVGRGDCARGAAAGRAQAAHQNPVHRPARPCRQRERGGVIWTCARFAGCRRTTSAASWIETYEELFNLRFQFVMGQLEDHNRLTALRRDIARMKTILRERELAAQMEGEAA